MARRTDAPGLTHLRVTFSDDFYMGPGRADLLEGIAATGSISAAGKAMGMSYKRAWALVEEMNAAFRLPLVTSARGGAGGGGASLTDTGREVLAAWQAILPSVEAAAAPEVERIVALLGDMSDGK